MQNMVNQTENKIKALLMDIQSTNFLKWCLAPNAVLSHSILRAYPCLLIIALVAIFFTVVPSAQALNAPAISPTTNSFTTQQTVTMSVSSGAIFYTTDGSTPTNASTPYTVPFVINSPTQLNAVAYLSGVYSTVTTVYLDVDPNLAPILQTGLILRLRGGLGTPTTIGAPPLVTQWTDLTGNPNSF